MSGTLVTLLVFLGLTIAFGYLSGKASASTRMSGPVKTAVNVTFIVMIVSTLLILMRAVRPWLSFGNGT